MDMANKKAGKDILKDILTGDQDHHVPGLDELTQLITQQTKPQPAQKKQSQKKTRRQQPVTNDFTGIGGHKRE